MLVTKTLAAKAGTVVAISGLAVGGVAATANAATAHRVKEPTILTAKVGPTHINRYHRYGAAHFLGQLTGVGTPAPQLAGKPILLERETATGKWRITQHGRTGGHGYVRFVVHHVAKGATFRLVFRGQKNFDRAVSNVVVISAS
jgi:hypothetical protein